MGYLRGDVYGLVEVVGISNQKNKSRWGFLTPKGTYLAYMLSIVLRCENTGGAGVGDLKGD